MVEGGRVPLVPPVDHQRPINKQPVGVLRICKHTRYYTHKHEQESEHCSAVCCTYNTMCTRSKYIRRMFIDSTNDLRYMLLLAATAQTQGLTQLSDRPKRRLLFRVSIY